MSVMSAAEAGGTAKASPDLPRRRLRLATSAPVRPDENPVGPPGSRRPAPGASQPRGDRSRHAGAPRHADTPWDDDTARHAGAPQRDAEELRATETRVRQVRVVREVNVRTLRVGSRSAAGPQPAATTRPTAQSRTATQSRTASQSRTLAQSQTQTHTRLVRAEATSQTGSATGTRFAARAGAASEARASEAWAVSEVRTRKASQSRAKRTSGYAGPARPQPARPGALRLTRRGRRVVAGFAVLVALVAVVAIWIGTAGSVQASSGHATSGSPYQGMTQIVVRPGQTLWSVAAAAEPSNDPWAVVQQIINVNALNGPEIHAGELLWIPKS